MAEAAPATQTEYAWITVEEAAEELRIGTRAAYHAIHSGELPAVRIGSQYRIYRKHLEQLSTDLFDRSLIIQKQVRDAQARLARLQHATQDALTTIRNAERELIDTTDTL